MATPALDGTRPEVAADPGLPKQMLIGGQWCDALAGETLVVENPGRREPIGTVPRARAADVDRAVAAAAAAFPAWSRTVPRERGRVLLRIADAVEGRLEELARLIARETGNALRTQARGEARFAADSFRYFGGLAGELRGATLPLGKDMLSYTRREPIGVVGAIVPWNAPAQLASLKIAPAICAGNTIVLKAAEDAPLAVLLIARVCQDFLPPGVVNVLTGYGSECGAPLAEHPLVRKLSFTGSTAVGKSIMRAASDRLAPVPAPLGVRRLPGQAGGAHGEAGDRRSAGRGDGHRLHHQRQAVRQGVRLRAGRAGPQGGPAGDGRPAAQGGPPGPGLLRPAHRLRRHLERLAPGPRGDLRPCAGGDPLGRRGGGAAHGQRQPLRPRRLRLEPRHRPGAQDGARGGGGLGPGEPGRRPGAGPELRRREAERHRAGDVAGRHAGQLHRDQDGERQPGRAAPRRPALSGRCAPPRIACP